MFRSLVRSQEGISADQEDSDADEVTVPFRFSKVRPNTRHNRLGHKIISGAGNQTCLS